MTRICRLVLFATTSFVWIPVVNAQGAPSQETPAPAVNASPTMEQTIAFINQVISDDTSEKSVWTVAHFELLNTCQLEYSTSTILALNEEPTHYQLTLTSSNTPDVSVSSWIFPGGANQITLVKARITFREVPLETNGTEPITIRPEHISPMEAYEGYVKSFDGATITFISTRGISRGKLLSFTIDKHTEPSRGANYSDGTVADLPSSLSDIAPGKFISITTDMNGNKREWKKDHPSIMVADSKQYHLTDRHIAPSDAKLTSPNFYIAFKSADDAKRVAKALIHAMVLCHKSAAPSLF